MLLAGQFAGGSIGFNLEFSGTCIDADGAGKNCAFSSSDSGERFGQGNGEFHEEFSGHFLSRPGRGGFLGAESHAAERQTPGSFRRPDCRHGG